MSGLTDAITGQPSSFGFGTGASRPRANQLAATINAGGFTSDVSSGGRVLVRRSGERLGLVNRLSGIFGSQAGELRDIRSQVRPGFSEFRRAGLAEIENRRVATTGNLRENLARRRISGSSFAEDTLARAEAEFAQEAATFSAQATLQELDSFTQLTQAIGELRAQEVQTLINDLNLEADVALQIQSGLQSAIAASAVQQQVNAGAFQRQVLDTSAQVAGFGAAGGFG